MRGRRRGRRVVGLGREGEDVRRGRERTRKEGGKWEVELYLYSAWRWRFEIVGLGV